MRTSLKLLIIAVIAVAALSCISLYEAERSDADTTYNVNTWIVLKEGDYGSTTLYSPTGYGNITASANLEPGRGILPPGMAFYTMYGVTAIQGSPTVQGIYTFTVHFKLYDQSSLVAEQVYTYTVIVNEQVTYHNTDGTTTTDWYSPFYPHSIPNGAATSGNSFCGWNTESDGSGTTYLFNSIIQPGTKDLYAQQSSSPLTIGFHFSSVGSATNLGVISGQNIMLPQGTNLSMGGGNTSLTNAFIGWTTNSDGSGTFYSNNSPVQMSQSQTLYRLMATTDPSYTVVITGFSAYYVPRGESFDFEFKGNPLAGTNQTQYIAPIIYGTQEVVYEGYTMLANTDVICVVVPQITSQVIWVRPIEVAYDANGGTGTMESNATGINFYKPDQLYSTKAPICTFTPPAGKIFQQWHIGSPSGPGISPGGEIMGTGARVVLYAGWMDIPPDPVYTITYDANGGSGSIPPSTVVQGNPYTITSQTFTAPNQKSFEGWVISGGGSTIYQAGDPITPTSDITIVAIWKWDYFYFNLVPNGAPGNTISQTTPGDGSLTLPESPFTWQDHIFAGWRVNNEEPTLSVGYEIWPQGNVNLYAQWIDVTPEPPPDNSGNNSAPGISMEWIAIAVLIILVLLMMAWMVIRDD